MGSLIMGLFLGLLAGILALICTGACIDITYDMKRETEKRLWCIAKVSIVVLMIFGAAFALYINKQSTAQYVHKYMAEKQMIESSLANDNLTGFERAELVKLAAEKNGTLATYQYKASQWYGFDISDKVLDLKPIDLSVE